MLEPHLATMFCFLATDAVIAADALAGARSGARWTARSIASRWTATSRPATRWRCSPMVSPRTRRSSAGDKGCAQFRAGARRRWRCGSRGCSSQDGEGATKLVEVAGAGGAHAPGGADRRAQRGQLAAGQDRHLRRRSQLGPDHDGAGQESAARIAPDRVAIRIGDERARGARHAAARSAHGPGGGDDARAPSTDRDRPRARRAARTRVWTSDLTEEYVRLNSKYTT